MKADLKKINYRKEETTFKVKHNMTELQQFKSDTHRVQQSRWNEEVWIRNTDNTICGIWETRERRSLKKRLFLLTWLFHVPVPFHSQRMSCLSDPPEINSVSAAKKYVLVSFANTYFVTVNNISIYTDYYS